MDTKLIGSKISEQRKKIGMTQEELAEIIGVSVQAISKWENGWNLPDIENLNRISEALKISLSSLLNDKNNDVDFEMRDRIFNENNMYTKMKTIAQLENLPNTLSALNFMREMHKGQFRKGYRYSTTAVEYINHPLMMACHAHSMGVTDDSILAAILLHDVLEDTETTRDDLPVIDEVKALVELVTFRELPDMTKEESKKIYYKSIQNNIKACVVKVIDRCNNVSTMAGCFSKAKLVEYIEETEEYIMPLLNAIKNNSPEYSNVAFIVKYHIISLLESIKALILE